MQPGIILLLVSAAFGIISVTISWLLAARRKKQTEESHSSSNYMIRRGSNINQLNTRNFFIAGIIPTNNIPILQPISHQNFEESLTVYSPREPPPAYHGTR